MTFHFSIITMCLSLLNFAFSNLIFLERELTYIEDTIIKHVREFLSLNKSSTRSYVFLPKSKGGLGILNPRIMYYSIHLAFYLSVLNSNDPNVEHTAKSSLYLHMNKRKVAVAEPNEENFAGFLVQDNKLVKTSKAIWPKSDWQHIFEMCQREGIELVKHHDHFYFSLNADEDIHLKSASPKEFQTIFKTHKLNEIEKDLKDKNLQGRIIKESGDVINHKVSSKCIYNHNISDKIRSFIVRGRLQVLECNSLLHLYYPETYFTKCALCNHPLVLCLIY